MLHFENNSNHTRAEFGAVAFLPKSSLSWWTPYWSHCPKMKRAWQRLFNLKSLVRIVVASLLSGLIVVFIFWLVIPFLPLGRLWLLGIQIPGLMLALYGLAWIFRSVPERVTINRDSLIVRHGDQARRILKCDIVAAKVVIFAEDKLRLRIWFNRKRKRRSTAFGIASCVDITELQKAIGALCQNQSVVDARERFVALRQLQSNPESRPNSTSEMYCSSQKRSVIPAK